MSAEQPATTPGRLLLEPAPLAAAAALALNVWIVRTHYPGFLSGKLSDLAICFLLPIALLAAWEWLGWGWHGLTGRDVPVSRRHAAAAACAITVIYFTGLQLSPAWGTAHTAILSALFPFRGFSLVTPDPTDLVCLVMVAAAARFIQLQGTAEVDALRAGVRARP